MSTIESIIGLKLQDAIPIISDNGFVPRLVVVDGISNTAIDINDRSNKRRVNLSISLGKIVEIWIG